MHLILLTLILKSLAAICAKKAALISIGSGLCGMINVWLAAEVIVLIVQAIIWSLVLRRQALTVAYPFMSLQFGIILFAAWLLFDETVQANHIIGTGLIMIGVLLTNVSVKHND